MPNYLLTISDEKGDDGTTPKYTKLVKQITAQESVPVSILVPFVELNLLIDKAFIDFHYQLLNSETR